MFHDTDKSNQRIKLLFTLTESHRGHSIEDFDHYTARGYAERVL